MMTTTYTSKKTFGDYLSAKIATVSEMKNSRESTNMVDNSDGSVTYHKQIYDLEGDRNWFEVMTIRTETLVIRETGKVVSRKECTDLEYWGTSTRGKSYFVHRIIEQDFTTA